MGKLLVELQTEEMLCHCLLLQQVAITDDGEWGKVGKEGDDYCPH